MTIFNGGTVGAVDAFEEVAADAVVVVAAVADAVVLVVDEAIWDGTATGEFLTACLIR